ncbi:hypothetical protein DWB63_07100 [Pseudodesulfovibrio sp. S3]|nr:hypothetical protein DWB63_07100 [Pseudodesulfovibrio sp. S3]
MSAWVLTSALQELAQMLQLIHKHLPQSPLFFGTRRVPPLADKKRPTIIHRKPLILFWYQEEGSPHIHMLAPGGL